MKIWSEEPLKKELYRLKALTLLDFYNKGDAPNTIIDFLAGFIALLKDNKVEARELNYRLFSYRKTYEFLNILIKDKIIERVSDGIYSLTQEAQGILRKVSPAIDAVLEHLESSYISTKKKEPVKKSSEREEVVL